MLKVGGSAFWFHTWGNAYIWCECTDTPMLLEMMDPITRSSDPPTIFSGHHMISLLVGTVFFVRNMPEFEEILF